MGTRRLLRSWLAALALAGLVLTGCSSRSAGPGPDPVTSHPPAGSAPTAPVQSSPVASSPAPHPHRDPYPALCRLVVTADAQKLFRVPLGPMTTGGTSDCQFAPRGAASDTQTLKVFLRLKDGDKTLYNHVGDISYGRFAPLSGVGYQAKWGSTAGSPPTVVDVRDGVFTCTVIPPSDLRVLTLEHSGSASDATITRAAAATYAQGLARICHDIFAAR